MKAEVYCNDTLAGILEKNENGYTFTYDKDYISDDSKKSISLTLPKHKRIFKSSKLFPFFYGLLTEGISSKIQCRKLKIDEEDYFQRLLKTADKDNIGCILIKEIK